MNRSIDRLTAPEVRAILDRSGIAVLSFGSIEQHGAHLPCGTDTMAADLVAADLAERLDALVVPGGPYGVTPIHAGHPGTISLRRRVFEEYVANICEELASMGASVLVLVNWHEGNIASLDAVATDLQDRQGIVVVAAQACCTAQRIYAERGGGLTHGGAIETMAVMAVDPVLVRWDSVSGANRPDGAEALDAMRRSREVYGYITDVSELASDGWYGDPAWATPQLAAGFAAEVGAALEKAVRDVLAVRGATR
ncbi:MAG TPA: creatininase family protein [Acidimicrobiia bacterium]|nr:creatininase family protein [Acidimicrobiia bacterium]